MDNAQSLQQADHTEPPKQDEQQSAGGKIDSAPAAKDAAAQLNDAADKKTECKNPKKHKKSKSKKSKKGKKGDKNSDSSAVTDDEDDSDGDSSSSGDSSAEHTKGRHRGRRRHSPRRHGKGKGRRSKKAEESSDSSSDDSDDSHSGSDSSEEESPRRRKKTKGRRSRREKEKEEEESADEQEESTDQSTDPNELVKQLAALRSSELTRTTGRNSTAGLGSGGLGGAGGLDWAKMLQQSQRRATKDGGKSKPKGDKKKTKKKRSNKRASTLEYKRVDQLWDSSIHNYKLTETAEDQEDEFDEYVFNVRRKFDWENKYKNTVVDIKSKILRDALQEVMKDVKSVSLVEDQPSVDPNMLFLYIEELRTHAKKTLKAKLKAEKKRKVQRRIKRMRSEVKLLLTYLDQDYADTKRTLYPMLEAGNITFDLIWALFKPNSIAYTATYGATDEPRAFKVDYANKESSFMRGDWYCVEGQYLEYDGKQFGLGNFECDIEAFKGPRKITSLTTYPLKYHRDPEGLKKQLIERGKRFVGMEGMNYRFHKGLAFMKKKRNVAKVNINGRIMIDPAIFRRINPNYPISLIKRKDPDELPGQDSDDESSCGCGGDSDDDEPEGEDSFKPVRETKFKAIIDKDKKLHIVEVPIDENGRELRVENMEQLPEGSETKHEFTEEELLIASPVVLGFAFSEKLWLEFSLNGVHDIEWNEGAFDSLVLPDNQKTIVKALVESHKFHAAKTIDDVVQGKGKGLVAVLHGPPGTGKTLTAEGIAELLKCPLYMVSAGELGTDPRMLEAELQKILDIAHSWGAVLLLDEADVFLERREVHDIHRNALVSIFLRLLEYFQGILFLTTNRVETFDDAFQSRIHIALRYGELTTKAKKSVWKMFLSKVSSMEAKVPGATSSSITEEDFDILARKNLNGRQIKNAVRTAQALAVNTGEQLGMEHIKRVLVVGESFEKDLKGGTGYEDAMRSYT
ncbi:MAG: hypothetical protein Q9162_006576 [Coniocarpon cinnabarinum]